MINKLLLIDDDELTSYLIKKLVKSVGGVNEIVVKENGFEGMEYLSQLIANQESFPEIILLDIDMPVMNGYEFAEFYEENFWMKFPSTKVIMITSSKRKHDFEKCLSFRCVQDCVYKPLTRNTMEQIFWDEFYQHSDHHLKQA